MNSDYSNEIQNFNIQQLYLRQFQALKMQKKSSDKFAIFVGVNGVVVA